MKKTNVILSAAVAGLFAVSAYAGNKAAPTTQKACEEAKGTWTNDKCEGACGSHSCKGAATKTTTAKTTTTTTTTTAPATTAPATK